MDKERNEATNQLRSVRDSLRSEEFLQQVTSNISKATSVEEKKASLKSALLSVLPPPPKNDTASDASASGDNANATTSTNSGSDKDKNSNYKNVKST